MMSETGENVPISKKCVQKTKHLQEEDTDLILQSKIHENIEKVSTGKKKQIKKDYKDLMRQAKIIMEEEKIKRKDKEDGKSENTKEEPPCKHLGYSPFKAKKKNGEGMNFSGKQQPGEDLLPITLSDSPQSDQSGFQDPPLSSSSHEEFSNLLTSGSSSSDSELSENEQGNLKKKKKLVDNENLQEVEGVLVNLGPKSKRKRACPFRQDELEEIVRFVDGQNYEEAPKGDIHSHKGNVMLHLSSHLFQKFGTVHTKRQCQKRWHDLKNRETKLLIAIRKKIRTENLPSPISYIEPKPSCSTQPVEITANRETLTSPIIEEDLVTLTLHPVEEEETNNIPKEVETETLLASIEQIIERVVSRHMTQLQTALFSEFRQKLDTIEGKQSTLLLELESLKNRAFILSD